MSPTRSLAEPQAGSDSAGAPAVAAPGPAVAAAGGPALTTHVITTDATALAVAGAVARLVAPADPAGPQAALDDQVDVLTGSGLLGITVPRVHGGADVSAETLLEVFRILATADPAVAQVPQSHVVYLNVLRRHGTPDQRRILFAEALAGRRIAGAQAEPGATDPQAVHARLCPQGASHLLSGTKGHTSGARFAHWFGALAKDPNGRLDVAFVPADAPGVTVHPDWDAAGERTAVSGTVRFDEVRVPAEYLVPYHRAFEGPQLHAALTQALHAAIDTGIARAALQDALDLLRHRPGGPGDSPAVDGPLTAQRIGELTVRVRSAEAVLAEAGRALDAGRIALAGNPGDTEAAAATSLAVATARVVAEQAALAAANGLVELAAEYLTEDGAGSAGHARLHRHWRNARTHTLHDPVRWRLHHLGRHALTGVAPPADPPR